MSEIKTENVEETGKKRPGKKEKPKKTPVQELIEWVVTILAALAIAFVVRTFVGEPVRVDGHSMDYTLADGEIMLVSKYDYLLQGGPQRFDVVICHYPGRSQKGLLGIETQTNFVKRVVGMPGDTVAVQNGYLYVNGVQYEEPYIVNRPNYNMSEYVVPEGTYFVLGDNRSNSNDSHLVGPLDKDMIVGHVRHVIWSVAKDDNGKMIMTKNNREIKNGMEY